MRGPLAVRINDGGNDRHITRHVSGLKFRKTAPGGHASGSMKINRPLSAYPGLGPADKVYVYDARTGATVMEGYTENPGGSDGPDGQSFDLGFLGNIILASDESRALLYRDTNLGAWDKTTTPAASAEASTANDPATSDVDTAGMKTGFTNGPPINTDAVAEMHYKAMRDAGMEIGSVHVALKSGKADSGYRPELVVRGGVTADVAYAASIGTSLIPYDRHVGAHFSAGTTLIALRLRRTGVATNVADDTTWTWFTDVAVVSRRMNRYGTLAAGIGDLVTNAYVRADWVVEDLLGRVLTMRDPILSVVEPTAFEIDQLAFPDGTTAAGVLDALALYEPDMVWEVLHSTSRGVVFRYRKWPTTPRYEVSVRDGYTAPGSEYDLCNRIAVYWTDPKGAKQVKIVTSTVPELGTRVKDADEVTIPEGQGSERNAVQLGQQVLAAKNKPPKAGKVTIRRPILDRLTGNTVMPWEIEPGYLMTVREVGHTLRMTEIEYDDDSCSTTVTLGEPTLTMEQRIARLSKVIR